MKNGFDEERFMDYMQKTFTVIDYFTRNMISNIIDYAHEHEHISKDQFCDFISKIIPEVEFGEVAMFIEDECLTEYGQAEKNKWLRKNNK